MNLESQFSILERRNLDLENKVAMLNSEIERMKTIIESINYNLIDSDDN
jgi:uncharacterized small protein (DUF1192 family)